MSRTLDPLPISRLELLVDEIARFPDDEAIGIPAEESYFEVRRML